MTLSEIADIKDDDETMRVLTEWNALCAKAVATTKPNVSEMIDLCLSSARHRAADARVARKVYGQAFSMEAAREVAVFEATARMLERFQYNVQTFPKQLKMVLGG